MAVAFRLSFRLRSQGGRSKLRETGNECDISGYSLCWGVNLKGEDIQRRKEGREAFRCS